ncbi:alpha/beta fold hydrolase [Pelagovum pacificum]|uniref:Alpha/beta hydrolase n=1 Tax=Pelagovum pacificum TaxID=2588711 RepID=A0A5C5G9S4_9RHOB|nr:alpha/beta fold hydrolase [Pelagovum pacificum]QQA41786.1 alpha/beta fold hydrolase [Pelagovum pacificum]TNY30772.1 alpha/beta hydrolase [Pelagovum pacificum]
MSIRRGPTRRGPGVALTEVEIDLPRDWSDPEGETIQVFLREACDPERVSEDLPLLLFLQGGPGGKAPRPGIGDPPWLYEAMKHYRVLLLDQRGTGRSSPVTGARMGAMSGPEGADYLASFSTDSIVRDCEQIRKDIYGGRRWSTLGQSYGGFLTLHYLSVAPDALTECFVTGGLAGIEATADDVYRRTYPRVLAKNERFSRRYPDAVERAGRIADLIATHEPQLPDGDRLSVRRFQLLGLDFGMAPGFENVMWAMDEAFDSFAPTGLSETFLSQVMALTSFSGNPLFVTLQESIYAQNGAITGWAAERQREAVPQVDPAARPLCFTGEMMFPWMFEEIRALRPFRAAAEALAQRPLHRKLYDLERLASAEVPVAAVIYHDDMYVDAELSLATAASLGDCRTWVTNTYEHDGLRRDPAVFRRLRELIARAPR